MYSQQNLSREDSLLTIVNGVCKYFSIISEEV